MQHAPSEFGARSSSGQPPSGVQHGDYFGFTREDAPVEDAPGEEDAPGSPYSPKRPALYIVNSTLSPTMSLMSLDAPNAQGGSGTGPGLGLSTLLEENESSGVTTTVRTPPHIE